MLLVLLWRWQLLWRQLLLLRWLLLLRLITVLPVEFAETWRCREDCAAGLGGCFRHIHRRRFRTALVVAAAETAPPWHFRERHHVRIRRHGSHTVLLLLLRLWLLLVKIVLRLLVVHMLLLGLLLLVRIILRRWLIVHWLLLLLLLLLLLIWRVLRQQLLLLPVHVSRLLRRLVVHGLLLLLLKRRRLLVVPTAPPAPQPPPITGCCERGGCAPSIGIMDASLLHRLLLRYHCYRLWLLLLIHGLLLLLMLLRRLPVATWALGPLLVAAAPSSRISVVVPTAAAAPVEFVTAGAVAGEVPDLAAVVAGAVVARAQGAEFGDVALLPAAVAHVRDPRVQPRGGTAVPVSPAFVSASAATTTAARPARVASVPVSIPASVPVVPVVPVARALPLSCRALLKCTAESDAAASKRGGMPFMR